MTVISGKPVLTLLLERIPATLELALVATALSVLIALPPGILGTAPQSGGRFPRHGFLRAVLRAATVLVGHSVHAAVLRDLAFGTPFRTPIVHRFPLVASPIVVVAGATLALGMASISVRYVRSALLEVLGQEYVLAARAKGLPESVVLRRYALRNALIAVVTILGLQLGDLLGGTLIIESLFAWPGVGRLVIQAIAWRDYFGLLQAAVLYLLLAFMLVTLVVDLLTGLLDPRVRYR